MKFDVEMLKKMGFNMLRKHVKVENRRFYYHTDLLKRYEEFYLIVRELVAVKGLSASVYTQTTDVETETNGLMTYDRKVDKMGYDNVRRAMSPEQKAQNSGN